ncbi:hypothetical protein L2755_14155 [Shewanella abyssi]|uniref:hypothetical protein n=1 Tax=Shewanella abyssi TaxID=311789 RepID=UPI00200D79C6|nr:hypothetical protein [Shewanella abyssi]MCL1050757.1 hypothetical protein [Shewanella abyssi]
MRSLSTTALLLTLGYFVLWCLGPVLLADQGYWFSLPIWFWFSCILAPLLLIIVLVRALGDTRD